MSLFGNKTQTNTIGVPVPKPSHWRRRLYTIIALIILAGIAYTLFALYFPYSDGERTGVIRKISQKGIAFKTWEGELQMSGIAMQSDQTQMNQVINGGNVWEFSVERDHDDIIKAIQTAEAKGNRVTLHYKQYLKQFDWRGETTYFITSVEEAPK